jgi:hypothetical protein
VGFILPASQAQTKLIPRIEARMARPDSTLSRINIDFIAVAIALTLATLIRFNILPPVSF